VEFAFAKRKPVAACQRDGVEVAQAPQRRRVRRQINAIRTLDRVATAQPVERIAGAAAYIKNAYPLAPRHLDIEQRRGNLPHADVPPHAVFEVVHRAVFVFTHSSTVTSDERKGVRSQKSEWKRKSAIASASILPFRLPFLIHSDS